MPAPEPAPEPAHCRSAPAGSQLQVEPPPELALEHLHKATREGVVLGVCGCVREVLSCLSVTAPSFSQIRTQTHTIRMSSEPLSAGRFRAFFEWKRACSPARDRRLPKEEALGFERGGVGSR